ncbi:Nitrogen fixation protein FixG [uncultured Gammaproteobacteria bacterium]
MALMSTASPPVPSAASAPVSPVIAESDIHHLSQAGDQEQPPASLFAKHLKVYPRKITGLYRRLKWAALVSLLGLYFLMPWVRWDRGPLMPDQAVFADLAGRRLYVFSIELWPQDIYLLTGLLAFCAFGLFLTTALSGRLWCGYACPHTVWTDLFQLVERWIEGDRAERIRLDKGRWTQEKFLRKIGKHAAWLLIAVCSGTTFVSYFNDAQALARDLPHFNLTVTQTTFIFLFTFFCYFLAGYLREHVCIYMCPWPRFQAAMVDEDSLIVSYQALRGEQRAPLRKSVGWEQRKARGLGDCIDCHQCQHVCPTGVDIRNGQQLACIGCGICIDACNEVMVKIGRPGQLIAFDTLNRQVAEAAGEKRRLRLIRPRTLLYLVLMTVIGSLIAFTLATLPKLRVSVLRDRAPTYVLLAGGDIRNAYTLKLSNISNQPQSYTVSLAGIAGATLTVGGEQASLGAAKITLHGDQDSVTTYRVLVRVPRAALTMESTPLRFVVQAGADQEQVGYESVFLAPRLN